MSGVTGRGIAGDFPDIAAFWLPWPCGTGVELLSLSCAGGWE